MLYRVKLHRSAHLKIYDSNLLHLKKVLNAFLCQGVSPAWEGEISVSLDTVKDVSI